EDIDVAGRVECVNPVTGEMITSLPEAADAEIRDKIEKIKGSLPSWQALGLRERSRFITQVRKRLVSEMDRVIDTICDETGKPDFDGFIEILVTCEIFRFVAREGPRALKPEKRSPGFLRSKRVWIHYLPYGGVAVISPWNYPLILTAGPIVQALMAGNGVILKPSEYATLTALKLKEIFDRAGFPSGIFQVVVGSGSVGEKVVEDRETRLISFTGSIPVGKKIAVACAERLKPAILELGGKDPVIVLEDANLDRAARAAVWGGFHNGGQTCISVERVFVVESVAEDFIERLTGMARQIQVGADRFHSDVGSIIHQRQLDTVVAQVNDARNHGARVLVGGDPLPGLGGFFLEPTVVTGAQDTMEIMKEETFGPVIAVSTVKNAEEAMKRANSGAYGLNASIFTEDRFKARQMAERLEAGNICINDVLTNYLCASLPFGGTKESGIGRLQGLEGLRSFARTQSVCEDWLGLKKEPWWFPVTDRAKQAFRSLVRIRYG
ncbi:MAG: aldehyde dehydrogenase family protein, partial [Fidelibacterota bacterium]